MPRPNCFVRLDRTYAPRSGTFYDLKTRRVGSRRIGITVASCNNAGTELGEVLSREVTFPKEVAIAVIAETFETAQKCRSQFLDPPLDNSRTANTLSEGMAEDATHAVTEEQVSRAVSRLVSAALAK